MQRSLPWFTVLIVLAGGSYESLLRVPNAPYNTLTLDAHHTLHFIHPKGRLPPALPSVTPVLSSSEVLILTTDE